MVFLVVIQRVFFYCARGLDDVLLNLENYSKNLIRKDRNKFYIFIIAKFLVIISYIRFRLFFYSEIRYLLTKNMVLGRAIMFLFALVFFKIFGFSWCVFFYGLLLVSLFVIYPSTLILILLKRVFVDGFSFIGAFHHILLKVYKNYGANCEKVEVLQIVVSNIKEGNLRYSWFDEERITCRDIVAIIKDKIILIKNYFYMGKKD